MKREHWNMKIDYRHKDLLRDAVSILFAKIRITSVAFQQYHFTYRTTIFQFDFRTILRLTFKWYNQLYYGNLYLIIKICIYYLILLCILHYTVYIFTLHILHCTLYIILYALCYALYNVRSCSLYITELFRS